MNIKPSLDSMLAGNKSATSSTRPSAKSAARSSNSSGDFEKIFSSIDKKSQSPSDSTARKESQVPSREIETKRSPYPATAKPANFEARSSQAAPVNEPDTEADQYSGEGRELDAGPGGSFRSNPGAQYEHAVRGEKLAGVARSPVRTGAVEAKVEQRQADESVDNLTHRQALQSLLKRMKEELGVEASDILEAFSALSPEELLQPPQANLDKLVAALPLDANQQAIAKSIFQDMLKQTASHSMADYLKSSHRQLSLEVLSRAEANQRMMAKGLDSMQSQFFLNNQPSRQMNSQAAMARYQDQLAKTQAVEGNEDDSDGSAFAIPGAGVGALAKMSTPSAATTTGAMSLEGLDQQAFENLDDTELDGELSKDKLAGADAARGRSKLMGKPQDNSFFPGQASATQSGPTPNAQAEFRQMMEAGNGQSTVGQEIEKADLLGGDGATDTFGAEAIATPAVSLASKASVDAAAAAAGASAGILSMAAAGKGSNSASDDDQASDGQDMASLQSTQLHAKGGAAAANGPDNFVVPTQPTNTQQASNIKEIVSQAQFMAKKGGGEMKIALAPEGLGQVTMKVAVQGGQVSVEMVAQSNDAKKLIEKGLGELKATLMANNLKVDQIKVDTPADVSRQLTQNHDEAQRQFAQQFMEQFRHDNNEWRGNFYDISGARSYRSQKEEAEHNPVVSSERARKGASSRRLDLVA